MQSMPTGRLLIVLAVARAQDSAREMVRAAAKGDVALVNKALRAGVHADATDTSTGLTALQSAAMKGHADVVKALIDAGADVDVQFNAAWSALAFAADHANDHPGTGSLDTVAALLEAGANPLLQDLHGFNALARADSGTAHHALIEARVLHLTEAATRCNLTTGEQCSDREITFADKWKGKAVDEIDAQLSRLNTLLNSTSAGSIKPEQRKWLRQRRDVLSQIKESQQEHDEL